MDVREFEPKIKRLLDDHVSAKPTETVIKLIDIHDTGVLKSVIEETGISEASKADRIASATRRAITERMDLDLAFYERFSKLLDDTIKEYRKKRKSEKDYLDTWSRSARRSPAGTRSAKCRRPSGGRRRDGVLRDLQRGACGGVRGARR